MQCTVDKRANIQIAAFFAWLPLSFSRAQQLKTGGPLCARKIGEKRATPLGEYREKARVNKLIEGGGGGEKYRPGSVANRETDTQALLYKEERSGRCGIKLRCGEENARGGIRGVGARAVKQRRARCKKRQERRLGSARLLALCLSRARLDCLSTDIFA